ncbi:hypothetical protein D9M70_641510 [compost metagenome]
MISHHTLRGGQDRDAKTIRNLRDRLDRHVNATARLRNAGQFTNDWNAFIILQFDFDLGFAVHEFTLRVSANVTFRLKNIQNASAELRSRGRNLGLLAAYCVANTGQHIADRI